MEEDRLNNNIEWVMDWHCYTPRDLEDFYPEECHAVRHCWLHTRSAHLARVVIDNNDDELPSHP